MEVKAKRNKRNNRSMATGNSKQSTTELDFQFDSEMESQKFNQTLDNAYSFFIIVIR